MMKIETAFVTGATGLLGNNLVRELISRGARVKALVRSTEKGRQQFGEIEGVELIAGDMTDVAAFAEHLQGCDILFHTAAYFRDNYKGGSHWPKLKAINVEGTRHLLDRLTMQGYVVLSIPHLSPCSTANRASRSTKPVYGGPKMPMITTAVKYWRMTWFWNSCGSIQK